MFFVTNVTFSQPCTLVLFRLIFSSRLLRDVVVRPSSDATTDHACYPCNTILPASSRSRLTLMLLLRPMSLHPPSCTCVSSFVQVPPHSFSPDCTMLCTIRDVLKKYTPPPWLSVLFSSFHFLSSGRYHTDLRCANM